VRAEWGGLTTQAGEFGYSGLAAGQYIVLYDPAGGSVDKWAAADGLVIDLSKKSHECVFNMNHNPICDGFTPFFGQGEQTLLEGFKINISPEGNRVMEGSIYSQKYGLILPFANGEPLGVLVTPGEVAEITVEVP
jgi:hypothetical protein